MSEQEAVAAKAAADAEAAKAAEAAKGGGDDKNKTLLGGAEDDKRTPEQKAAEEKAALDKKAADDKAAADEKIKYDAMSAEDKAKYDKNKADEKALNTVPDEYKFKLPEGMELDKEMNASFTAVAKKHKLTQGAAQELVDLQVKFVQEQTKASVEEFNATVKFWGDESKKELGADLTNKLAVASRALSQFGTPELRGLLDTTGIGNHKELIKFFVKIGEAISEDNFVDGKFVKGKEKLTDGKLFYPGM